MAGTPGPRGIIAAADNNLRTGPGRSTDWLARGTGQAAAYFCRGRYGRLSGESNQSDSGGAGLACHLGLSLGVFTPKEIAAAGLFIGIDSHGHSGLVNKRVGGKF